MRPSEPSSSAAASLLRPELPPQLVAHDRLVALPSRGAEELAEEDLGVASRDRSRAGLVVVPRIVEESDAGFTRCAHDCHPALGADALERPPRAEREAETRRRQRGTGDLISQYAFEGNAADSVGGNNGITTGSPAYAAGVVGQAINLDGVNDYVTLPSGIANHDDISLAAWVYWDGGSVWQRVFDFGNNTNQYMYFTPRSATNTMRFAITTGSNGAKPRNRSIGNRAMGAYCSNLEWQYGYALHQRKCGRHRLHFVRSLPPKTSKQVHRRQAGVSLQTSCDAAMAEITSALAKFRGGPGKHARHVGRSIGARVLVERKDF